MSFQTLRCAAVYGRAREVGELGRTREGADKVEFRCMACESVREGVGLVGFKVHSLLDCRVPWIVVVREHLIVRALYVVLLLVEYSRIEDSRGQLGVVTFSLYILTPFRTCPLYFLWPVSGRRTIVVSRFDHTAY